MGYNTKVQVDERGIIQKESVVDLTSQDWGTWIEDQLHGRGLVHAFVEGELAESLFLELVPYLELPQRFKTYEGIIQCLDAAYKNKKSGARKKSWTDIPLDDLLSLVGGIETKWEGSDCQHQDTYFGSRSYSLTRFLDVVNAKPTFIFSEDSRDIYFRVLQALCSTEAKLSYEFWAKHLQKSPRVYGMLCFSGAANNSPYDGINLLSHVDWSDEETRNRMEGSLLIFYGDNHANIEVIAAIEKKKLELPLKVQAIFDEAKEGAVELVEKDNRGEF